ncbi:hypothetical protein CRV02_12980 [Arcobacter sp. CECT 8989]|nr:DUF4209 domain-containing protein [Arcobacter sp. CECT 8989]RXJ98659.1 hypothetical protein CRV02_12980 [Arcobacter sp. CECT 8989]
MSISFTHKDLKNTNYLEVIKDCKHFWDMKTKLYDLANKYDKNSDLNIVLNLLSEICAFQLNDESLNEPYTSFIKWEGISQEYTPKKLVIENLELLEYLVDICDDYRLKAFIADFLWLYREKRNFTHLLIAIDSFIKFPLDEEHIFDFNSIGSFRRAIKLSLLTKQPVDKIKSIILENVLSSTVEQYAHCSNIFRLLLDLKEIEEDEKSSVYRKLTEFAIHFEKEKDYKFQRTYLFDMKKWLQKTNDDDKKNIIEITCKVAESFINEAFTRTDNAIVAAKLFESAIHEYRTIPNKHRKELNINERIEEIHKEMTSSNLKAIESFTKINIGPVDITKESESSIELMKNSSLENAIVKLAFITYCPNLKNLDKESREHLSSAFSRTVGSSMLLEDGRVAAETKGTVELSGDAFEEKVKEEVHSRYAKDIQNCIKANIIPAFIQFITDHTITKDFLNDLCIQSNIVPRDRATIWAEGLYFGFERNFLVSTHLLIPQVEYLIRTLLKQAGVRTTVMEQGSAIEVEKGLNTLLDTPDIKSLLDNNILEELKHLLTYKFGYNLRNDVSHGISSKERFNSEVAVYLWWLLLKLVIFNSPYVKYLYH